jgi:dTDP-4-dehydrorhamnose reductase
MKIGIIGSSGRLGYYMRGVLNKKQVAYTSFNRSSNSLQIYRNDLEDYLVNNKFSHIINLSACTNLEFCENNLDVAVEVNETLVHTITEILTINNLSSKLIQISTDQVYGESNSIKRSDEDCPCKPLNAYAITKHNAEKHIQKSSISGYMIARINFTGMSFSYANPSFSDWLFKALINQENIRVYTNIFFNPIHALDAACIILNLIAKDFTGIINIGSTEILSKSLFCKLMASRLSLSMDLMKDCEYSATHELVKRPNNMITDVSKLSGLIGPELLNTERLMNLLYYQYASLLDNDLC